MSENKVKLNLAAIDPYVVSNIVSPTETKLRNKDFIQ